MVASSDDHPPEPMPTPPAARPKSSGTRWILFAWIVLAGTGQGLLLEHANRPGERSATPLELSSDLRAALGWRPQRPLLVVVAHPQCPCLPATLGELADALADDLPIELRLLVYTPSAPPADWDDDAALALQRGLRADSIVADTDGTIARGLGSTTSGHLVLCDRDGRVRFSGGITGSRGHAGDNAHGSTLRQCLADVCDPRPAQTTTPVETPVFGCALREQSRP
jgi:hypothetical protein